MRTQPRKTIMNSLIRFSRSPLLFHCLVVLLLFSARHSSGQTPAFTNVTVGSDGLFHFQLRTVVGQSYTFQTSTNLSSWTNVGSLVNVATNLVTLVDQGRPVANFGRMFYRVRVGVEVSFSFNFHHYANAGGFGSGFTPATPFPVSLNSYSATFSAQNDTNYPPATNVFFTGPAGSGLSSTPADPANFRTNSGGADYQSPVVFSPAAAPGGIWTINYKGTNQAFNVPDPQASSRLVVPSPTISVSGDIVQSVSWVYRDANTGATLGGAPSYLTRIQVQIEGVVGGRIYNSPNLTPPTTSHLLSSTVNWSNVSTINMAYDDSLGNHYVLFFHRP